ncbi:hypothetical protein EV1_014909 [Malus domestica]
MPHLLLLDAAVVFEAAFATPADDLLPASDDPLLEDTTPITFNALESPKCTRGRAMRLLGHIRDLPIRVFVDSGADLNFLNPSVATRLGLCIDHSLIELIMVVNGRLCYTTSLTFNLSVQLHDYSFSSNLRLLPVVGSDLVLGAEWLETLGYIGWHFKNKIMEFQVLGSNYRLHGLRSSNPLPSPVSSQVDFRVMVASLMKAHSHLDGPSPTPPLLKPIMST